MDQPVIMQLCKVVAQSLASEALFRDALMIPLSLFEPASQVQPPQSGGRARPSLGVL